MSEPNLYCINGRLRPAERDPHNLKLRVSDEDRKKFSALGDNDPPIVVTDLDTDIQYRVRRWPCGLGCHCAAYAIPMVAAQQIKKQIEGPATLERDILIDAGHPLPRVGVA